MATMRTTHGHWMLRGYAETTIEKHTAWGTRMPEKERELAENEWWSREHFCSDSLDLETLIAWKGKDCNPQGLGWVRVRITKVEEPDHV